MTYSVHSLGRLIAVALMIVGFAGVPRASMAQCVASWKPGQSVPGVNGSIECVLALPNGDVVVGGSFSLAGDARANSIARYTRASNSWSSLATGIDGTVSCLLVLPSGDILAGGFFTSAGGVEARNIARYSPASNSWSPVGLGVERNDPTESVAVFALAMVPGSTTDIVVGGGFDTAGGVSTKNLARVNLVTNTWSALGSDALNPVFALAPLPGGDLLVGGGNILFRDFTTYSLARLSPATGTWVGIGGDGYYSASSLIAIPGGDVIVAESGRLLRFAAASNTLSVLGGLATGGLISDAALLPGARLLLSGSIRTSSPFVRSSIGTYDISTQTFTPLSSGVDSPGDYADINSVAVLPNGEAIAAGWFRIAGGVPVLNIARVNESTSAWAPLGTLSGINGMVFALAPLPSGDAIVGGSFTLVGGVPANGIARYSPRNNSWSALGQGVNGIVFAVLLHSSGDFFVSGSFSAAGGAPASRIARYSPATGAWSALGSGLTGGFVGDWEAQLIELPGGDILVSSGFEAAGGVPAFMLARYSPGSGTWSALGTGGPDFDTQNASYSPNCALEPSGDVVVTGCFSHVGSVTSRSVARYHPGSNSWSPMGPGLPNDCIYPTRIVALPSGELLLSGNFSEPGSTEYVTLARFSPTTQTWSEVPFCNRGFFGAMTVIDGGEVLFGGLLRAPTGELQRSIFRWNPTTDVRTVLSTSFAGLPAMLSNGDIIAGGGFGFADGVLSASFARYSSLAPCRADFDCSGGAGVNDIFAYLNAWFMNDLRCNVDALPGVSLDDLFTFLNVWFAGC